MQHIPKILFSYILLFLSCASGWCQHATKPFSVDTLFDLSKPETLGLSYVKNSKSFVIFSPDSGHHAYNHGVVLFPFNGVMYAQWQSAQRDEDAEDTHVWYSRSSDGAHWSAPEALTDKWADGITTSGGWWRSGDTLIAFINVWPDSLQSTKSGFTLYKTSVDGKTWSMPAPVRNADGIPVAGVIEQDLRALPDGRVITAFHMQPGLVATPYYTDDPSGLTGWKAGVMPHLQSEGPVSREIEPSWFYREDSAIVMIFRDQKSSFKKLAALSVDRGAHWTKPVLIDTPDSRAKQSAGNLPDGTAFMVNNPSGNKNRYPLVITLSKDGVLFDRAYLIRAGGMDLPKMKYEGIYKRIGFSYPKSVLWKDHLYVAYAVNKEDIVLTRIPIEQLY